jgi:hypothetical protein
VAHAREGIKPQLGTPELIHSRSVIDDTEPIGLALRRLSDDENAAPRADVEVAFAQSAAMEGYVLPCIS